MAKVIKSKTDINKYFDDLRECTYNAIVDTFSRLGVECVNKAREAHAGNWKDQTGNLRSSIGFIVTYNGDEIKKGGFEPTAAPNGNGAEGQDEGKRFIEGLKGTHSEGFALVLVAGMNYAEYVEALDGYDVLAHVELWARDEIGRRLKQAPKLVETLMKEKGW